MSVLELPRVHFSGQCLWNPDTCNNSPQVYNENSLQLTGQDAQENPVQPYEFVRWLGSLNDKPPAGQQALNGSWNVFGDASCWFRDARVVSVQLDFGTTAADPISEPPGLELQILGDPRPLRPTGTTSARMVDVAPYQSTTTQIFYKWFQLGDENLGFRAAGACRMFLRWSMLRNTDFAQLPIAGPGGVIFQTAAHNDDIEWFGLDNSPGLQALHDAACEGTNQGVSMQFAVYLTQYYKNASFQGQQLSSPEKLAAAYEAGFTGGNPAQSEITGTVGVWGADELASAPTGILLAPDQPVSAKTVAMPKSRAAQEGLVAAAASAPQPFPLGPATARASIESEEGNLALNLMTTVLETDLDLTKERLGPLSVNLVDASGSVATLAKIPYSNADDTGYDKASYRKTSGILDLRVTSGQACQIRQGTATLQVTVEQAGKSVVALEQTPWVVETDQRGEYLDQGEEKSLTVRVYKDGQPASGLYLLVAQYVEQPQQDGFPYVLVTGDNQASACLDLGGGGYQIDRLPVKKGEATFTIKSVNPGTVQLGFQPYDGETPLPLPMPASGPTSTTTSFYATVRCLGYDNALLDVSDDDIDWLAAYVDVLQLYDLVYPAMSQVFPLSSEQKVDAMAQNILTVTDYPKRFDWTLFMPVSREMSAGKRSVLRRYCEKVLAAEKRAAGRERRRHRPAGRPRRRPPAR